jgi:ribosome biogenesis SPOUT family RNA methylase Rps3
MENYLFEWCLSEYRAMKEYLRGTPARLIITNAQAFYDYAGEHAEENKRFVSELEECFQEDSQKYQLRRESLTQMAHQLEGRVCMLDMRGQQELSPGEDWNYIVFGGVLGDHPPRDRPAPLRQHFVEIRHLGAMQLATDTAVLVSRLILCNRLPIKSIPMVEAPTIRGLNKQGEKTTVQMEGFSYVSRELDIATGVLR